MATFLLTYNPDRWDWEGGAEVTSRSDLVEITADGGTGVEPWTLGTRKSGVAVGDRILLLRQGPDPRGLVASGTVTSEPYLQDHWDQDRGGESAYVDVAWDAVTSDRDLLPVATLIEQVPDVDWMPRSGGRTVPEDQAERVTRLWSEHLARLREQHIPERAWLMLAAGEDAQFGGNEGYEDDPSRYYSWDNLVKNHAGPQPGDVIVLWDKRTSLGASVIEDISTGEATKTLLRCPRCGKSKIKSRATTTPRWRCQACEAAFDDPTRREVDVTTYRTSHEAGWADLPNRFTAEELRAMCVSPKSQHSIRPMVVERVIENIPDLIGRGATGPLVSAVRRLKGGHVKRTVRARVGQQAFRAALLARLGPTCAFTGPTPPEALEAAHLVSYAKTGQHDTDRGLLLRRDLHRLFDDGLITWDPATKALDVAPELEDYPVYASLHGEPLQCTLTAQQRRWLKDHHAQHRLV